MLGRLAKQVKKRFADRRRDAARRSAARAVIGQSSLFNPQWYLERYPDVASIGMDPLDHFIAFGAAEGRNPSERFDIRWYLKRHPDIARTGINPLLHYLEHGRDEGRAIRSVPKSRTYDEFDPLTGHLAKETVEEEPPVAPYPSDFSPSWQARQAVWRDLPAKANENGVARNERVQSDEVRNWSDELSLSVSPDSPAGARVLLFQAIRSEPSPPVTAAARHSEQRKNALQDNHSLLRTHGLGLEAIIDGWFMGYAQLILRVDNPKSGASRLRAFQLGPSSEVLCCADDQVLNNDIQMVRLTLEHELYPLLLTWHGANDSLVASAFIPFPSLFRGGLHHVEITGAEVASDAGTTLRERMTCLALQSYFPSEPSSAFAIQRLVVDLRGATGSEPIFSHNAVSALSSQFGLELRVNEPGIDDAARLLECRLAIQAPSERARTRIETGQTLILPPDAFPSLACLAARTDDANLDPDSFYVVNATTREPEALVKLPALLDATRRLHHPALPLSGPILDNESGSSDRGACRGGAPAMIRFREAKTWQVDDLMPLSPDTPFRRTATLTSRITVIVDNAAPGDPLSLCLASLAHQTVADHLDILLIGDQDLPPMIEGSFAPDRINHTVVHETSRIERLKLSASSAVSDYLLFIDASVCLPDPRTLDLLLEVVAQPQVGSAACALVREDDADGSISIECAGYVATSRGDQTDALSVLPADVASLLPASTYPVVANDMRLCLVPTNVWQEISNSEPGHPSDPNADLDFGLRAGAAGLHHYCTTLARAVIADGPRSTDEARYAVKSMNLPNSVSDKVTHVRKIA